MRLKIVAASGVDRSVVPDVAAHGFYARDLRAGLGDADVAADGRNFDVTCHIAQLDVAAHGAHADWAGECAPSDVAGHAFQDCLPRVVDLHAAAGRARHELPFHAMCREVARYAVHEDVGPPRH